MHGREVALVLRKVGFARGKRNYLICPKSGAGLRILNVRATTYAAVQHVRVNTTARSVLADVEENFYSAASLPC